MNKRIILILLGIWLGTSPGLYAQDQPLGKNFNPLYEGLPEEFFQQRKEDQTAMEQTPDSSRTYTLPFASRGNSLELALTNTTGRSAEGLKVEVAGVPEWMELRPAGFVLGDLEPGAAAVARFTLHVDEQAPVGQPVTLTFRAESNQKTDWSKQIVFKVDAPKHFKLFQNYPNPFNGSTMIQYWLPQEMQVTVQIYNVLGQRVATLADEVQQPGTQTINWEARRQASGLYFCRITAKAVDGTRFNRHKKMLLIK